MIKGFPFLAVRGRAQFLVIKRARDRLFLARQSDAIAVVFRDQSVLLILIFFFLLDDGRVGEDGGFQHPARALESPLEGTALGRDGLVPSSFACV